VTNRADEQTSLVAAIASVRDDDLRGQTASPQARRLLASILDTPLENPRGSGSRRAIAVAIAAFLVATVLSIPALGVGSRIESLFAGWHDPDAPVPTESDVVIASGEAGVHWKIVATPSDQGLCLGLFYRAGGDSIGSASCGYTDIRGPLPPDLRGDPRSECIATPTALAPCGSLPLHWIDLGGGGESVGLERRFAFGAIAADVASVDLLLSDGKILRAQVVAEPGWFPLGFYWASWPCPVRPVTEGPYRDLDLRECRETGGPEIKVAVARDAEGRVLERRVSAWNGNPTGDPAGASPPG
jgi:hypothetical protein